jgi:hypothetical protein
MEGTLRKSASKGQGFARFTALTFDSPATRSIHQEASVMKSLASPSFFRLFDLLVSHANPGLKLSRWIFDGVEFERERHSFMGPKHGVAIEIFTLTHGGRRGWTLMVTKEYWWAGEESKALKNLRWARATDGQRGDVMAWLRAQEAAFDRLSKPTQRAATLDPIAASCVVPK